MGLLENEFICNDCDYVFDKWEQKYKCPSCESEDITVIDEPESILKEV